MSALDTVDNIIHCDSLMESDLKFCYMDSKKIPYKPDGSYAKPNHIEDFVTIDQLVNCCNIDNYAGVGISIQASNISAIDVDHCFSIPFDIQTGDSRAVNIINLFKSFAYIEFSYSGTGLRILFRQKQIDHYNDFYYIKNSKNSIEYYQPSGSFRYVTVTGRTIVDNKLTDKVDFQNIIFEFLDQYMKRTIRYANQTEPKFVNDERSIDQLLICVKKLYLKDYKFQDLWFSKAPGSGHDESERDFNLLNQLYNNITKDKEKLKALFEMSPFYQSKDSKHTYKWTKNNFWYYNYVYKKLGYSVD